MTCIVRLFLFLTLSMDCICQGFAVQHQLHDAVTLATQGRYSEAIALGKPVPESPQLSVIERGRGWSVIAQAYVEQGDYQNGASAFEHALELLKHNPNYLDDYASALDAFSILYRDLGNEAAATHLQTQALHIYKRIGDHAGVAIVFEALAEDALGKNRVRQASKYIDQSEKEAVPGNELDDQFNMALLNAKAWTAQLQHKSDAAIEHYQKALELRIQSYGRLNASSGWGYMLLGKSYLAAGNTTYALQYMREGLGVLEQTAGKDNIKYLVAELAYVQALNSSGEDSQAAQIEKNANAALRKIYQTQCVECRITIAALH